MNKKNITKIFLLITFTVILVSTTYATNVTDNQSENVNSVDEITSIKNESQQNIEKIQINTINKSINENDNETNTEKDKYITNQESSKSDNTDTLIIKTDFNNETYTAKTSGVMDIPLDKNRKIYFAMDHTSKKDQTICNNVVNTLKKAGFNVVRYKIGPSAMYNNILYLYNNNIKNAIMFHLCNGVDPSNIREVAKNGNDNRGRIVRSRGNDVVLAWFYDASDPIHVGGSCYSSVKGSETGSRLYNPKQYMDKNGIYYICTSSDHGKHKSTADYTGTKTVQEFMKLFIQNTKTTVTNSKVTNTYVTLNGTVTATNTNKVNGTIIIKDSSLKTLNTIKVTNGTYTATVKMSKAGDETLTVNYQSNSQFKASETKLKVNIPLNFTIAVKQIGDTIEDNKLEVILKDDKTNELIKNKMVYVKVKNSTVYNSTTDNNGKAIVNINTNRNETVEVYVLNNNQVINKINHKLTVYKHNTTVIVENMVSTIGEKIILKAYVVDENNNPVSGGNLVFKLNGKTLKVDNSFTNNIDSLKFNVTNGIVTYTITSDLYLRKTKNITATYSGSYKYVSARSNVTTAQIRKRYAEVIVETDKNSTTTDEEVILKATVKDITPKGTNSSLLNYKAYVFFKVNGKTIKNAKGNNLLIEVDENYTASYKLYLDPKLYGVSSKVDFRTLNITAVFTCENYYPTARNSTTFNIVKRLV